MHYSTTVCSCRKVPSRSPSPSPTRARHLLAFRLPFDARKRHAVEDRARPVGTPTFPRSPSNASSPGRRDRPTLTAFKHVLKMMQLKLCQGRGQIGRSGTQTSILSRRGRGESDGVFRPAKQCVIQNMFFLSLRSCSVQTLRRCNCPTSGSSS